MTIYRVDVEFIEPMLGGAPLNNDIYGKYIVPKKGEDTPTEPLTDEEIGEELETLPESEERGMTGFHRDCDGKVVVYNYTWKGYFKESCGFLRNIATTESKGLTMYKKKIDGLVFVYPRRIPLVLTGPITHNTRPLRAQTMKGERISIACSEQIPVGSSMSFEVLSLADSIMTEELLREWFQYGALKGFGQWRNASWGTFTFSMQATDMPEWAPKLAWLQ